MKVALIYVLFASLLSASLAAETNHWAVIVAGSRGWYNYRHQADTLHAYQIVKGNGIPDDHIILMNYDDIANATQNKFKGKMFNAPTKAGVEGTDVYGGARIDYTGKAVSHTNLIKVFLGDESAGGPVLKSDENSKIFFFFDDHGAPGYVAMPHSELTALQLVETVTQMKAKKMFKEMVMYIETCESGSMFSPYDQNYTDLNVYALSAANPHESSWGTYCRPNDTVDGKELGTCLGDLFSVSWMEDTVASGSAGKSLHDQFLHVQKLTTRSHVMEWGDKTISSQNILNFQSNKDMPATSTLSADLVADDDSALADDRNTFGVDTRDAYLQYLYAEIQRNPSSQEAKDLLHQELAARK